MKWKETAGFIQTSAFIFGVFLFLFVIRFDLWQEDTPYGMLALALTILIPMAAVAFVSLFSARSEYEGAVGKTLKETPLSSKIIVWTIFTFFSLIFFFAEFAPLPSAIFLCLLLFSWVASFVGVLSQRLVIGMLLAILDDNDPSRFARFNRYLNATMFGYIYVMYTRMASLPWYIRKPVGILIMVSALLSTMVATTIFNP